MQRKHSRCWTIIPLPPEGRGVWPSQSVGWEARRKPEEIAQLDRGLEETVLSILADAGIDLRTGGETYVEDAYFVPTESE